MNWVDEKNLSGGRGSTFRRKNLTGMLTRVRQTYSGRSEWKTSYAHINKKFDAKNLGKKMYLLECESIILKKNIFEP